MCPYFANNPFQPAVVIPLDEQRGAEADAENIRIFASIAKARDIFNTPYLYRRAAIPCQPAETLTFNHQSNDQGQMRNEAVSK
jgi:hypothetical protein